MSLSDYPRYAWPAAGFKLICDGNSLTAGLNASSSSYYWPSQAASMTPLNGKSVTPINTAVSGQGIATINAGGPASSMQSRAATYVDAALSTTLPNILTAWEFTNEVKYLSGDGDQAYANFRQYCLDRKAAAAAKGAKLQIVVATAMPAYYSSVTQDVVVTRNQGLVTANAMLRNGYREFADILVDIAAIPMFAKIFSAGTFLPSEFDETGVFSDRVHLTDTTYRTIAAANFSHGFRRVRMFR